MVPSLCGRDRPVKSLMVTYGPPPMLPRPACEVTYGRIRSLPNAAATRPVKSLMVTYGPPTMLPRPAVPSQCCRLRPVMLRSHTAHYRIGDACPEDLHGQHPIRTPGQLLCNLLDELLSFVLLWWHREIEFRPAQYDSTRVKLFNQP